MTKQVIKKQETEVANQSVSSEWGDDSGFSAKDLVISKILPMQGLSKLVAERKAMLGEFRDSVTGEKLGSIDNEPIDFIPFKVDKLWVNYKVEGKKVSFAGVEPVTPGNENLPFEEIIDGVTVRRDYTYYVYVLLPKHIADGEVVPYIISLKRTSLKCGKKIMTQMYGRNKMAGKSPAHFIMKLHGKLSSNDQGTYVVLDADTMSRESTKEEVSAALAMLKMIKSSNIDVDHSDDQTKGSNQASTNREF